MTAAASGVPAIVATDLDRDEWVLAIRSSVDAALETARELVIDSEQARDRAADLLAQVRKATKAAEKRRLELVKPHNDHVSAVNGFFRGFVGPMKTADSALEGNIIAWNREQKRKADEAAREAERRRKESERLLREAEEAECVGKADAEGLLDQAVQHDAGASSAQAQARLPSRVTATASGSVGQRKKPWTYDVVDLEKVPRQYLCLDAGAVRRAINDGVREIPGLRIRQPEGVAVR